jgi:hypothetical protein
MCPFWGLKKYRQANRVDIGLLIAQNQPVIGDTLSKSESVFNEKKMLVQASTFWLLNVLFSDEYFEDGVAMNHATKHKDKLDRGKAGRSEHLWLPISVAYNDSTNDEEFGEFAFS